MQLLQHKKLVDLLSLLKDYADLTRTGKQSREELHIINSRINLVKRVWARCDYGRGVLHSHTKHTKCDGCIIMNEDGQLQTLTKGHSIRYCVHASERSDSMRTTEDFGI